MSKVRGVRKDIGNEKSNKAKKNLGKNYDKNSIQT